MSKVTKAWAIVAPSGDFVSIGLTMLAAVEQSNCELTVLKAQGYRCIRVTITPEQEEPK